MALSHGLHPSLRDALVVVAGHRGDGDNGSGGDSDTRGPVAGAGRCDAMTLCDGDEAWVYAADNAGAGITAEQPACTWAVLRGE